MACSKIFSGDLPELTKEIIQYFRKDFSTLYSCILVNRLWCRLAIPLLWEDPFSLYSQNYRCIVIYLSYLNEDGKEKFNEYKILNNLLPSNKLFNYPSFIKYLNTNEFYNSIKYWLGTLKMDKYKELEILVYRSLFEIFIENEGNLHSFEVVFFTKNSFKYFYDNMDLILHNSNFTHNIRHLTFRISDNSFQNIITFLKFLYSNCNSILSIVFELPILNNLKNPSLTEKYFSQIIISQHNLKKISFNHIALYNPFLSLKNSNCSNNLSTIIFHFIDFKDIISILKEVFDQLNVLESIHIFYCKSLNFDFVQQIIKVIKPFKLRSLFMREMLHNESLQFLLQKIGDYLENFGFRDISDKYNEQKPQLFKLVMKYCTKIRYLHLGIFVDNNIYLFIENNQHNINYLTIEVDYYHDAIIYSSIVLQNLGQVLPSKLEYLNLTLYFMTKDLEIFLRNSQNTFIKKLLIKSLLWDEGKNVLFNIKEFIMKKERIKYLAMLQLGPDCGSELLFLKDEVNEFKLHNIIVQKYNDLYISARNFINLQC